MGLVELPRLDPRAQRVQRLLGLQVHRVGVFRVEPAEPLPGVPANQVSSACSSASGKPAAGATSITWSPRARPFANTSKSSASCWPGCRAPPATSTPRSTWCATAMAAGRKGIAACSSRTCWSSAWWWSRRRPCRRISLPRAGWRCTASSSTSTSTRPACVPTRRRRWRATTARRAWLGFHAGPCSSASSSPAHSPTRRIACSSCALGLAE